MFLGVLARNIFAFVLEKGVLYTNWSEEDIKRFIQSKKYNGKEVALSVGYPSTQ